MKPSHITTGQAYEGANGSRRYVYDDADSRSSRQQDRDEVQYIVVRGKQESSPRGRRATCTRRALGRWAVKPVRLTTEEQRAAAGVLGAAVSPALP